MQREVNPGALGGNLPYRGARRHDQVSWPDLFRYRTVRGMMTGLFCLNFTIYFYITWFPSYLLQARGFSLTSLGTFGMLPALLAIPAGSFVVPLAVAGGLCVVGSLAYLFVVGKIEPLPMLPPGRMKARSGR